MTEEIGDDYKFPLKSKTEIAAILGILSSAAVAFGYVGMNEQQIAALSGVLFLMIAYWRIYGGPALKWTWDQLSK
ncbi:hypothetical protein [Methanothrix sp.]|jgi:hypothetical protein|uniref:hypothetical protein n=1 Tax=Methanothrix sp. TaxID=90426 RepID=UPI0032AEEA78